MILDIKISDELRREGIERELIRKINDKRKSLGLTRNDISDIVFNNKEDYDNANENVLNITKLKNKSLNIDILDIEINKI
ncbi:MAG: DUF5915 domain-containing protein [Cyanobium sp. MAG06]|nr:DUF5915 domain-containing protein [Cyanobium sp. MAG06]